MFGRKNQNRGCFSQKWAQTTGVTRETLKIFKRLPCSTRGLRSFLRKNPPIFGRFLEFFSQNALSSCRVLRCPRREQRVFGISALLSTWFWGKWSFCTGPKPQILCGKRLSYKSGFGQIARSTQTQIYRGVFHTKSGVWAVGRMNRSWNRAPRFQDLFWPAVLPLIGQGPAKYWVF